MAKKQTNSSEKEERKVKYHDAFKPNIEQKSDAVKSQQYVKKKLPEKIELTQEQVWDLKRPKYVLYDTKEKPSSDTRTSAQRNADYWDPVKGASERNKSKMDNGKHPIQGLAKTVGTSALIATGALELPALATWGGLGARALVGGAQGLGYGMLGMSTGNPVDDFTYGAMGEVGIPVVGGLLKDAGVVYKSAPRLIKKEVKSIEELLNKSVQNARAFKPNENMVYRGIGEAGLEDAINSGVLRSPTQRPQYKGINKRTTTYWAEPEKFNVAVNQSVTGPKRKFGNSVIVEYPRNAGVFDIKGVKNSNGEWTFVDNLKTDNELPIDKAKFYREHWLKGYKEIKVPKKQFQSEIDWGKWNKEIPENKELMQEYKTIEQSSKADGSWMKNPDGSAFSGTPEQFVQQNSSNFKKAFPDGATNTFRGSVFHDPEFSRNTDIGFKSIFTGDENLAQAYSGGSYNENFKKYFNPNIPTSEELLLKNHRFKDLESAKLNPKYKGIIDELASSKDAGVYSLYSKNTTKKIDLGDVGGANWRYLPSRSKQYEYLNTTDDYAKYIDDNDLDQVIIKNVDDGVTGDVLIASHKPGNYLKSAIGNNGMFDMTNPNIYKGLIPVAGLYGLTQSKKQGGNMKYTHQFKLGGAAKILQTGGTSPNPWRKVSGSFNGVNYQGEVFSDKSKTNPSLGYVIYKDNNGKKFSRDLEGVITYDPKSTTQDSIAFQSILNNNGFNYGKGPATQSLDLLNSKMKEMKDDPWFKEKGQKNNNK